MLESASFAMTRFPPFIVLAENGNFRLIDNCRISLFVRADLRNHRMIVVIDDRVACTGSQNLVDPRYFKQDAGVGMNLLQCNAGGS